MRRASSPAGSAAPAEAEAALEPAPFCPHFHAAVETVGRRWTGAILWALAMQPHYYAQLVAAIPGLSDRLLSARLRELEAEGLVERSVHDAAKPRVLYSLSPKGAELEPCMRELADWARRWDIGGRSAAEDERRR